MGRHKGKADDLRRKWRYKKWQKAVFARDGYKCVECGSAENLTADHIKPLVRYPELAYEVSNGRTLCDKCRVEGMLGQWDRGELKGKRLVRA